MRGQVAEDLEQSVGRYTFTVCTATFNRSAFLPRLGCSLLQQEVIDLEWIIVDDGSTDNTEDVVSELVSKCGFTIRYLRQPNQGKHIAINRAAEMARGKWFMIVDSDDWLLPGALSRVATECRLAEQLRESGVVGIVGHSVDPTGRLIGTRFPAHVRVSDPVEIYYRFGVRGDKLFVIATDVMREFPFPQFPGEKFVSEGLVWARIASKYKVLLLDEPLQVVEYLPGGLTHRRRVRNATSPRGVMATARQVLLLGTRIPWPSRLWQCSIYGRFGLHAGLPVTDIIRGCPDKLGLVLTAPLAAVLFMRDRLLLKRVLAQYREAPTGLRAASGGQG